MVLLLINSGAEDEIKMPIIDLEAEKTLIRELILNIGDAFQRNDADAFIKLFHKDVVALYPNTQLITGVKQWKKFIEAAVRDNISVKYDEIIVEISESGDHGYVIGIFSGLNRTSDGQIGFTSRFHSTLWKIDGEWKIVAISYNH